MKRIKKVVPVFRPLSLSFCPTGSGGGIDNSCGRGDSSSGGSGGKDAAGMSKVADEKTKAIGSDMARNMSGMSDKQKLDLVDKHLEAANAHRAAESFHTRSGNSDQASYHDEKASNHEDAAQEYADNLHRH